MSDNAAPPTQDLTQLLGTDAPHPWYRRPTLWIGAALVAAAVAAAWTWRASQLQAQAPHYVTTPLARGSLAITVSATGTLQPTRTVSIGSELSGTVAQVLVDVNDRVKKGQLLVQLDTAKLQDAVNGSRADLAVAQAALRQAQATTQDARAALAKLDEVARLSGGKLPSRSDLDTARATLAKAEAAEASALAGIAQVKATLSTNETNLRKASIRSPIDGVVLTRAVEPGYAVAASLQAVTLFTLAEDLTKMELSVNVDEADVGQVRAQQRATFTVSAQPGRRYPALVRRVAYGSTTTDNVVTYTTLLTVDNQDLTLRPGMTATASIAATERQNVLLVPNSALRFSPAGGGAPGAGASGGAGIVSKLMPRPPGGNAPRSATTSSKAGGQATIWVLDNGQPRALQVSKGLSDGRQTEVSGAGLAEGLAIITDQTTGAAR